MIRTFHRRVLKAFWFKGDAAKIAPGFVECLRRRLDALDASPTPASMNVPGFDFHKLRGKPERYTVHVNGSWCVTFEWEGEDAIQVDFEDYH